MRNSSACSVARWPADPGNPGSAARRRQLSLGLLIGRNGEPSDFAGIVVFLASAASDHITVQTIYVDGGFSAT